MLLHERVNVIFFHFLFYEGENSSFTYWDTNEPKTSVMGDFEDCVMMEMDRAGRWGDVPCTGFMFSHQHHGYVCEYEKV